MKYLVLAIVLVALVAQVHGLQTAFQKGHAAKHTKAAVTKAHKHSVKARAKINPFGSDQLRELRDARMKRRQWREENGYPDTRIIEGGYELSLFMTQASGPGWVKKSWNQLAYDLVDFETEPLAFAVTTYLCDEDNNTETCGKIGEPFPAIGFSTDSGETWERFSGEESTDALGRWIYEVDGDELPVLTSSTPDMTEPKICTPFPPGARKPACLDAMKSCWRRWKFGKLKCQCRINSICGAVCPFNPCNDDNAEEPVDRIFG